MPFPGLPVHMLLRHLEPASYPTLLTPIWGWVLRGLAVGLPWVPVAGAAALFSAFCGAASVALLARIMLFVGYRLPPEAMPAHRSRELQARWLSSLVAALFLAVSIPFWIGATRSLPVTFHMLWLLCVVWLFIGFQRDGRLWKLAAIGALWGAGMAEAPAFAVFAPVAIYFVIRELILKKRLSSPRAHAAAWGGGLLGLMIFPAHFWWLTRTNPGRWASPLHAGASMLSEQWGMIRQIQFNHGYLVILFFCVVPWLLLFVFSRRSPWYYDKQQIIARLVFGVCLLALLFDAPFSPWSFLGMNYLMVTPYLLFAVCSGYMAGEFWIIGTPPLKADTPTWLHIAHRASAIGALFIPALILIAGACNFTTANGRPGAVIQREARNTVARLGERDVLFSASLLDDSFQWATRELQRPVRLIRISEAFSPVYLEIMKGWFPEPELQAFLQPGLFGGFVAEWMRTPEHAARTGITGIPEAFQDFGNLLPSGLVYGIAPALDETACRELFEWQKPFWVQMSWLAEHRASTRNPARLYQDHLLTLAAQSANNFGVFLAQMNLSSEALEAFRAARRIHPGNISALLNLLSLSAKNNIPEQEQLEADWSVLREKLDGSEWLLAIRYGFLWRARDWMQKGFPWALSGEPAPWAHLPFERTLDDPREASVAQLMDQIFLRLGQPSGNDLAARAALAHYPKNNQALIDLAWNALRNNDPAAAEAYYMAAMANGVPETALGLDRALLAWLKGDSETALEKLHELREQAFNDPRVWLALLLLGDPQAPDADLLLKHFSQQHLTNVPVRLTLAWIRMVRHEWDQAAQELELVFHHEPRNREAWEMMFVLGVIHGNAKDQKAAHQMLMSQSPPHPMKILRAARRVQNRGDSMRAWAIVWQSAQINRHPFLLHSLANLLGEQEDGQEMAQRLMDEALRCQPFNPMFILTDVELKLQAGQLDVARETVEQLTKDMPDYPMVKLTAARLMIIMGDRERARALLDELKTKEEHFSAGELARWREVNAMLTPENE